MRGNWISSLLLAVLVAVLVAAPATDAWAIVALCESELALGDASGVERGILLGKHEYDPADGASHGDGSSRLGIALGEMLSDSWLSLPSGMGGAPLWPPREAPEQERPHCVIEHVSANPAHMAATSTSVLSQGTGAGSTFALAGTLLIPPQDSLQASLPPEARTILPTGPPGRLFRPPRGISPLRVVFL